MEMSEEDLTKLLVRVDIPDLKTQVCCNSLLHFTVLQWYPDGTISTSVCLCS